MSLVTNMMHRTSRDLEPERDTITGEKTGRFNLHGGGPRVEAERAIQGGFQQAREDIDPLYDQAYGMYSPYSRMGGDLRTLQKQLKRGAFDSDFTDYQAPGMERFDFDFEEDPGYQFARDQGLDAINRQMRAKGLTGSTAHDQEAMKFATGLAGQQYDDAHTRALGAHTSDQMQRMGLAGMGQRSHEFGQTGRALQNQQRFMNRMGLGQIGYGATGQQAQNRLGLAGMYGDFALGSAEARANRLMGQAADRRSNRSGWMGLLGSVAGGALGGPLGGALGGWMGSKFGGDK